MSSLDLQLSTSLPIPFKVSTKTQKSTLASLFTKAEPFRLLAP
jgi:hypothetical protein